jgi:UDP-glucose 4-epimerase
MKILVTGAAGFIGSHVVDLLLEKGNEVLCLDDLSSGKRENLPSKIDFAKVDVGRWFDLVAEFVDFEPEAVIHLAAQPSICDSIENPIRDGYVNVMGTLNVIRASQKIGVKRLIFSSTSAVYSELYSAIPYPEIFPCRPKSPYGISKFAAESYVNNMMPENSVVFRFGNVYGPRQVPIGENQVIPRMIRHFEEGYEFFIHSDGMQLRDYIYVGDVARVCVMALTGESGIFNVANGIGVSVNRIAAEIEQIYGVPGYKWEYDNKPEPRRKVELDIQSVREAFSWEPTVGMTEGLQKTVEWWKAKPK